MSARLYMWSTFQKPCHNSLMERNNFSQLPNAKELQSILEAEIKRDIPKGKGNVHYIDFSPLIRLAEYFAIDTGILTTVYTSTDVYEKDLFAEGKVLTERLKEKLLEKELSPEALRLCEGVYDYLAEEDAQEKADLIFVFGAKTPLRIEKAIALYKENISEKILVSGRSPHYADEKAVTEAETYARIARESGVPSEAILVEDESTTLPDNVRGSLNMLDRNKFFYTSIILVNSPYTQRRGWAHFKKYTPDTVFLIRINAETGNEYRRDTWYKNQKGIDAILSEYIKAKVAVSLNTA